MMSMRAVIAALLLMLVADVCAHEVRPAYLRIQQKSAESFDLLWRVPARGQLRLGLYVQLPPQCENAGEVRAWQQGGVFVERWTARCVGGLAGNDIAIDGLSTTLTDVLARYERLDGTTQVARLTPASHTFTVTNAESWRKVAVTYGVLGVEHILLGIDHLLFVLALLLIVSGWRKLIATVTAFTVAHSITLALATLGFVNVPQAPVEAVIALSILFVAVEIVHWSQGREGVTRRKPWVVAFLFGLLHGLGFAGALTEIGLPEQAIPLALLFFNIGVEVGQLLFIGAALVAWSVLRRVSLPEWAWRLPVYSIGGLAASWTIERIAGF
jgi:hydrogenase/urease accessory protein HupE